MKYPIVHANLSLLARLILLSLFMNHYATIFFSFRLLFFRKYLLAVRGFQASRSPPPHSFNDKAVNTIATPANTEHQGAVVKYVWASFSIAPQVGIDGSAPTPRKLKAAPAKIAFAKINVPCTIIGVIILGNIYFSIMTTSLAPVDLAASIY